MGEIAAWQSAHELFECAEKDVSSKLLAAGIEPETRRPDELRKFQAAETQKWDKIARDAKIEKE